MDFIKSGRYIDILFSYQNMRKNKKKTKKKQKKKKKKKHSGGVSCSGCNAILLSLRVVFEIFEKSHACQNVTSLKVVGWGD